MEKQHTSPLTLADLQAALKGLATKDDLKTLARQDALTTNGFVNLLEVHLITR